MPEIRVKRLLYFVLGMLAFAAGFWIVKTFILTEKLGKLGIVKDWGEICLWQDTEGINLSVAPLGCFSSTCTQVDQQSGTAFVDTQMKEIHLSASFVIRETSRFPLPCVKNYLGGGRVLINLSTMLPNDYTLWFEDQKVGDVMVFSGRETPRQCFWNDGK